MNLFKEIVITAPVSTRLQFGHNENVIISAVDTSVRKVKGLPIKANTFITISQIDPTTRKVIAQNEFNYWNLDHTSDFVLSNFLEQFTSLASLVEALGKDPSDYESAVLAVLGDRAPEDAVKTKDGAKELQEILQDAFYNLVKDVIGSDCPLLKCKLVVNKKGFLEISKVQGWVLPMNSSESLPEVDAHEKRIRAESLAAANTPKTTAPDAVGSPKPAPQATGEKPVVATSTFGAL